MKVIFTKDTSRCGNDCYIYETVSMIEQFGMYAIIICQKITGWAEREDIFVAQTATNYDTAVKMFEDYTDVW